MPIEILSIKALISPIISLIEDSEKDSEEDFEKDSEEDEEDSDQGLNEEPEPEDRIVLKGPERLKRSRNKVVGEPELKGENRFIIRLSSELLF